jgi:putative SOS response-associated peptidase YedK
MCGRFAFYSPSEATAALFGVDGALAVEPRYNIAPTQFVAAIREDENRQRELTMLRWGLVPFWAKDPAIGNRMINARAETVAEKPSYRAAFKHRRCVVLADGFYEWHRDGDVKIPHFISLLSGEPFGLAALWESWTDKESGEFLNTTTLITTVANEFMQPLHHRMPVILQPDTANVWMSGSDDYLAQAADRTPALRAWPVDRRVNNARNQGEELIVAAGEVIN